MKKKERIAMLEAENAELKKQLKEQNDRFASDMEKIKTIMDNLKKMKAMYDDRLKKMEDIKADYQKQADEAIAALKK